MAIVVSAGPDGKKYLHPEGQFPATCIDIIDFGMVETTFSGKTKKQHKGVIRFWCGEKNEDGEPLYVSHRVTFSLSEKANLRKLLNSWRGRDMTEEELKAFDLEVLLGKHALIQVTHNKANNGNTYANLTSIMKLLKGVEPPTALTGYIRAQDRQEEGEQNGRDPDDERYPGPFEDDDDLPF